MWTLLLLGIIGTTVVESRGLKLLHQWRALDYDYPSESAKNEAIRKKEFIPGNPVPIDIDFWQDGARSKMFMTIPRFQDGVPASLVTINQKRGESPLLTPYPDWSWHRYGECDGVSSAFRTTIDQCGRLWVIDSGMVDLFKYPRRRLCQPKIIAFDLATDKTAGKHVFPNNVLTEGSVTATIAVDVRDPHDTCKDTFAYVADVTGFQLLVFDARRGKSWRVQSNSMFPYPIHGLFKVNGVEFDLMDGILGLALKPFGRGDRDRDLFYHSFAGVRESWVPTSVLRNESLFSTGFNTAQRKFQTTGEERPSQAAPEVFDKNGILYFGPVSRNAIWCWNSDKPYTQRNLHELTKDDKNLQFTTGIKVRPLPDGDEELYVFTTRFQQAMIGQMNPREINFRVLKGKISELTENTPCHKGKNSDQISFGRPNYGGYGFFG